MTLGFQPVVLSNSEVKVGDPLVIVGYSSNDDSGVVSTWRRFGPNEVTGLVEYETGEVIFSAAVAPGPNYEAPAHVRFGDSGGACVKENSNVLIGINIVGGVTEAGIPISYFISIYRYRDWLSEIVRRFGSPPDAGVAVPAPDAGS